MNDDMYFLPLIDRALRQPDPVEALRSAFKAITRMASEPKHRRGFDQFRRFMAAAVQQARACGAELGPADRSAAAELVMDLVADSFEGTEEEKQAALDLIRSRPDWRAVYDDLCLETRDALGRPFPMEIAVERDGEEIGRMRFEGTPGSASIPDIAPGRYVLELDTGRVIWEGELTERDLVWTAAFPGSPLQLAADTGISPRPSTREVRLLDGDAVLRALPGLASGRIELEITVPEVQ